MHSTVKLRDSDPHDIFVIEPEAVPATWADKVLADITRETASPPSPAMPWDQPPQMESAATPTHAGDTTFRAAAEDIHVPTDRIVAQPPARHWKKTAVAAFALCGSIAAASWQHYGDTAKQMVANWTPPFALASSAPAESTGLAAPSDTPAVQVSQADPSPPPPAAPAPESAAPAAATPAPDTAPSMQSMSRDLAAMGQQVEQLKAEIADLKASQQTMARDVAKFSEIKSAETKPAAIKSSELRTSPPNPRPRLSVPPPRSVAAPSRRPMPAYPPLQATAPLPQPLPQAYPPPSPPPAPPQQASDQFDDPVVRPPMPLR